jgi:hypothetical protein
MKELSELRGREVTIIGIEDLGGSLLVVALDGCERRFSFRAPEDFFQAPALLCRELVPFEGTIVRVGGRFLLA